MRRLLREIDIPPLWLAIAAAAIWGVARVWPVMLPGARPVGGALIALGLLLTAVAGGQMLWRRTSPIPRRVPRVMLDSGAFALSRNPIYLSDAIMLTGWMLWSGGIWGAPVVALFMLWITRRYILPEEAEIARRFGPAFDTYRAKVRRWL
ncbi:methyltransferase family protein [Paenirhodobacter enshiensis]|uniref:methyltransferase family protein n=1 Tax=Paenirhodobacter enshiensis TaxID=1105367 RepID=UPI0006899F9B|nr:isoprenylcysteine carboxylmethyltransferase family protein [Paenirhodobacter enshiensis]